MLILAQPRNIGATADHALLALEHQTDTVAAAAACCVLHRHRLVGRARHECALDATLDIVAVRLPELLGQHEPVNAAIHCRHRRQLT